MKELKEFLVNDKKYIIQFTQKTTRFLVLNQTPMDSIKIVILGQDLIMEKDS